MLKLCAFGIFLLQLIVIVYSAHAGADDRFKRSIFDDIFNPSIPSPTPPQNPSEPKTASCGKYAIEQNTTYKIQSPFFDLNGNYPPSHKCLWEFYGSGGCLPVVSCTDFKVVNSPNCSSDFFEVSDGLGSTQRFCGTTGPQNVSSGSSIMQVLFNTGIIWTDRGFRCFVSCASRSADSTVNVIPQSPLGKPATTNCTCGIPGGAKRIVGGTNATPNYWKWQASLVLRGRSGPFCGAALINDRFVLTAAHCVVTTGLVAFPLAAEVVLNDYDTTTPSETVTIRRSISTITPHPFYNSASQDYDISILEIYPSINLTSTEEITPICLPPRNSHLTYTGLNGTVIGFGTLTEGGDQATVLQVADIPIITNEECSRLYSNRVITPRMICAATPGVDSCQGDSGGPFMIKENDSRYSEIGVVSWGEGCARAGKPGVYARVTDMNDFIRKVAFRGLWCTE